MVWAINSSRGERLLPGGCCSDCRSLREFSLTLTLTRNEAMVRCFRVARTFNLGGCEKHRYRGSIDDAWEVVENDLVQEVLKAASEA